MALGNSNNEFKNGSWVSWLRWEQNEVEVMGFFLFYEAKVESL